MADQVLSEAENVRRRQWRALAKLRLVRIESLRTIWSTPTGGHNLSLEVKRGEVFGFLTEWGGPRQQFVWRWV